MKKYINNFLVLLLLVISLFSTFPNKFHTLTTFNYIEPAQTNLIERSNAVIPTHFRKSSNKLPADISKNINLEGLDNLNISGSGQFSENELEYIKNAIGTDYDIIDFDLREESHGFINGIAVSWENEHNNSNVGLSKDEILNDENSKIFSIKLNEPLTFYNTHREITPKNTDTEESLTKKIDACYIRIPVTDGHLPSDEMVQYFLDSIKGIEADNWLHFHCKEGIGRTTTFMTMYDIVKNYNKVSLNDIIKRQVLLSGISEKDAESFYSGSHYKFLENFYNNYKKSQEQTALDSFYINHITFTGNTESKIPITNAANKAPIIDTFILGTTNCAKYIITAAIIKPFAPFPSGDASTPIKASTA